MGYLFCLCVHKIWIWLMRFLANATFSRSQKLRNFQIKSSKYITHFKILFLFFFYFTLIWVKMNQVKWSEISAIQPKLPKSSCRIVHAHIFEQLLPELNIQNARQNIIKVYQIKISIHSKELFWFSLFVTWHWLQTIRWKVQEWASSHLKKVKVGGWLNSSNYERPLHLSLAYQPCFDKGV